MKIGIDFDNTIADYTGVFHEAALQLGWIIAETDTTKVAVKRALIDDGNEAKWTELQGMVYGKKINLANPYDGLIDALKALRQQGHSLFLVSHKTRYPYIGEKIDLHAAAMSWLTQRNIDKLFDHCFFCETKEAKLKKISDLKLDYFVDDLASILTAEGFPEHTGGVHFVPGSAASPIRLNFNSWRSIPGFVEDLTYRRHQWSRNRFYNQVLRHPVSIAIHLFLLRLIQFIPSEKLFAHRKEIEKYHGFTRMVGKPRTVAIQGGVCISPERRKRPWWDNMSQLWCLARLMDKNDILVAIEPVVGIEEKIKDILSLGHFDCQVLVVNKALYSQTNDDADIQVGDRHGHYRLHHLLDSDKWEDQERDTENLQAISTDTLDNILTQLDIAPEQVNYVNLTINGAEYDAVLGMKNLLQNSKDICLTIASGRSGGDPQNPQMGYIDGEEDYVAISRILDKYGFSSRLRRFTKRGFGFLVSVKGKQKAFM